MWRDRYRIRPAAFMIAVYESICIMIGTVAIGLWSWRIINSAIWAALGNT